MITSLVQTQASVQQPLLRLQLELWRGSELSTEDQAVLETCRALQSLSLRGCGLQSLKHFPALPTLLCLDLNYNSISGGLEALTPLSSLTSLSLAGNLLSSPAQLAPLAVLPYLSSLDLAACPLTQLQDYRKAVREVLPGLEDSVSLSEDSDSYDEDEMEQAELEQMLETEDSCLLEATDSEEEEDLSF